MDLQNPDDIPVNPDEILVQRCTDQIENKLDQVRQQMHNHVPYTICPFPDYLVGIDDRIRSPKLASFGPHHSGNNLLRDFEKHKHSFCYRFISRTESLGRDTRFYVRELLRLKESTRGCYSPEIVMLSDDVDLVDMMFLDGSFMVELFREYEENRNVRWPWPDPVQTLIADLLNLENQLPFFILKKLFELSYMDQVPPTPTLPTLALRFLNQAFCRPSDVINSQNQHPKHLLDLFRSSLLPSTETYPQQSKHLPSVCPIQCVKQLRSAGITVRQNIDKSLLEIDFRKFQIPPLALKIPPVAIDDFTSTILVNCVALEQCFHKESKHFTAYVYFMNCLMKQPEDVEFLRSVEIITRVSQDEMCFINMLNSLGRNAYASFMVRDCYLWEQFWEIHSYYNSCWASIRRNLFNYNNIMLYCSILQIAVGILIWRLSANSSTSSDPN